MFFKGQKSFFDYFAKEEKMKDYFLLSQVEEKRGFPIDHGSIL